MGYLNLFLRSGIFFLLVYPSNLLVYPPTNTELELVSDAISAISSYQ